MESIYIKNMVCDRCIQAVKRVFETYEEIPLNITLGKVILSKAIDQEKLLNIDAELKLQGFELIDSNTPVIVTKIKSALIEYFTQDEIPEEFKLSTFITEKFPYDYSHLSRVFSNHQKDTIEHFVIKLRIEKAKELLTYKDDNISEVAYKLGYVSAAHFSRQFKKLVGVPPSVYQKNPDGRISLEEI